MTLVHTRIAPYTHASETDTHITLWLASFVSFFFLLHLYIFTKQLSNIKQRKIDVYFCYERNDRKMMSFVAVAVAAVPLSSLFFFRYCI